MIFYTYGPVSGKKKMSRNYYKTIFILTFLWGVRIFPGAEALSLSLEDAVNCALASSINLQKSTIDLELAQFRAEHLWSELFPSLNLSGSMTFLPNTPLFTDPGFSYNTESLSYSVNFGITFRFNGGIPSSMKLTELAYQRGLLDYESARRRVALDITKMFNTLLAGKMNLSNLEEILSLAELQLEKSRIARENGLTGELPWLQSRLSAETARFNLSNARGAYDNSLKDFLTTLGIEREAEVVLAGAIDPVFVELDPEALILSYLPRRPDIISQRQTIEQMELRYRREKISNRAPSLSLSATWAGGTPNSNNNGLAGKFTDRLSGNLSVSIPIEPWIPGTSSNQSIRSADAELEKARLDLQNAETTAKANIRSLSESLKNSWASIEIARLRVEIAQRTYELSEEGFRSGVVEYLGLQNTQNDLADAQYRLLQSELAYGNLLLDLAAALNVDLETLTRSGA